LHSFHTWGWPRAKIQAAYADLNYLAAQGTLTGVAGGKPTLTGLVRYLRTRDEAAIRAGGGVAVEGELLRGTFAFRKGETCKVAIRNGASPVLLTGRAVDARPRLRGRVLAVGTLSAGDEGALRLNVSSLEAVPRSAP
jgi:hypothetical protein